MLLILSKIMQQENKSNEKYFTNKNYQIVFSIKILQQQTIPSRRLRCGWVIFWTNYTGSWTRFWNGCLKTNRSREFLNQNIKLIELLSVPFCFWYHEQEQKRLHRHSTRKQNDTFICFSIRFRSNATDDVFFRADFHEFNSILSSELNSTEKSKNIIKIKIPVAVFSYPFTVRTRDLTSRLAIAFISNQHSIDVWWSMLKRNHFKIKSHEPLHRVTKRTSSIFFVQFLMLSKLLESVTS